MLHSNERKKLRPNSNPTVALNFIGVLRAFARDTGTSLADVVVEANDDVLYVHSGWPSETPAQDAGPDVLFGLWSRYDATDLELQWFSTDHIEEPDGVLRFGLPYSHEVVPKSLMEAMRERLGDDAWQAVLADWRQRQSAMEP